MQRISGYFLLVMLVSSAAFAQSGWVRQTSGTTQNLTAVEFINAQTAVAVGDARTILRTTDGGATWNAVDAGTGIRLNCVSFANASMGVAAGLDGQILTTQNGGAGWTVVQDGWSIDYNAAQQLTPSIGFLLGGNAIFTPFGSRTTNGWQTHDDFAFYVDHNGSGNEGDIYGAHFFNDTVGCAAVAVWDGHGAVVKTTNGGASWETRFWTDHAAYAMDFPTPTEGFVCGDNGFFARTTDAGDSWITYDTGIGSAFRALKFINADTGWVAGDNGMIYRTDEGGIVAYPQISGVTTTLHSVDFVNDSVGYAVGDNGVILKTTTGGEVVNHVPGEFLRLQPEDGDTLRFHGPDAITFRWSASHDPYGDTITYHLYVWAYTVSWEFATTDTVLTDSLDGIWSNPFMLLSWGIMAVDQWDSSEASNGRGQFYIMGPDAAHDGQRPTPENYNLSAYPNPFNPTTTLSFSLPQPGDVNLRIFDIEGRTVFEKRFGVMSAGEHRAQFDGTALPSGVYISRLETAHGELSQKLVLMK
jgi:photosystem II stability/assembly factor-like uncharacterized protein